MTCSYALHPCITDGAAEVAHPYLGHPEPIYIHRYRKLGAHRLCLPSSVIRSLSIQRVHIPLLQWLEGVCAGTIGTRTKHPAQDCIIVAVPRFVVYVRDLDIKINLRVAFDIHRRKLGPGTCPTTSILPCTYIYSDLDDVEVCINTDSSNLVLLPLGPLLFALYLHLISQATQLSMPGPTSKSTDIAPQHGEYYINGADLTVRVRGFPSDRDRVVV